MLFIYTQWHTVLYYDNIYYTLFAAFGSKPTEHTVSRVLSSRGKKTYQREFFSLSINDSGISTYRRLLSQESAAIIDGIYNWCKFV